MIKKACLFIVLIIYLSINCGYAQSEINFYLPNFPPFTYEKDGKIQGIGVELASKIFNEAGIKHSLTVTSNYRRAVEYVRAGKSDGFFLATQNAERDEIAVFSNPVFINRWSLVSG